VDVSSVESVRVQALVPAPIRARLQPIPRLVMAESNGCQEDYKYLYEDSETDACLPPILYIDILFSEILSVLCEWNTRQRTRFSVTV
jgi:hypothetical protein